MAKESARSKARGQHGGPRPNSGGRRTGAGRKPDPAVKLDIPIPLAATIAHSDAKVFLIALMNDAEADVKLRLEAAKALIGYQHKRLGDGGKKEDKQEAAKKIAGGKFASSAPPKLVAAGGKKI